jgi:hypothetical protein
MEDYVPSRGTEAERRNIRPAPKNTTPERNGIVTVGSDVGSLPYPAHALRSRAELLLVLAPSCDLDLSLVLPLPRPLALHRVVRGRQRGLVSVYPSSWSLHVEG